MRNRGRPVKLNINFIYWQNEVTLQQCGVFIQATAIKYFFLNLNKLHDHEITAIDLENKQKVHLLTKIQSSLHDSISQSEL